MTKSKVHHIVLNYNPETDSILAEVTGLTNDQLARVIYHGVLGIFQKLTNGDQEKYDSVVDNFIDALKHRGPLMQIHDVTDTAYDITDLTSKARANGEVTIQ